MKSIELHVKPRPTHNIQTTLSHTTSVFDTEDT